MTVDTLIMLSGAIVLLLPYLGFPNSWDNVLLVILGIFIIALGIVVRRQGKRGASVQSHIEASSYSSSSAHEQD